MTLREFINIDLDNSSLRSLPNISIRLRRLPIRANTRNTRGTLSERLDLAAATPVSQQRKEFGCKVLGTQDLGAKSVETASGPLHGT